MSISPHPLTQSLTTMTTLTRILGVFLIGAALAACSSQAQSPPPPEQQIAAAVQAAPADMQENATVLGYGDNGELTTLREGSNPLICLADDPADEGFHVSCYHESLEPFMQSGRDLRAQGHDRAAVDSIRMAHIEAGELSMPDHPASLYSLSGDDARYNPETGEVTGASPLYVIYAPFETGATTGLPTRPDGNKPWLMEPGTPWAHIMVQPSSGN